MLNINLESLEQFMHDFWGELDSHAVREIRSTPAYKEMTMEMKRIAGQNTVVSFLYEGNQKAAGHTLTSKDVVVFEQYYTTARDRENHVLQRIFCYGMIMGSNLSGNQSGWLKEFCDTQHDKR